MPSTERVNTERVKNLIRHLANASRKIQEREEARFNLNRQIKKVKQIAVSKKRRKVMAATEVDKLESAISDVLHKEITLLRGQAENQRIISDMNHKVMHLESELAKTREEDTSLIVELKNKLQELNEKLAESVRDEKEIKEDVEELVSEEDSRAKKIQEIEERLKAGFKFNKDGILVIEEKLANMEEKLANLEGKYGKKAVSKVRERVTALKEKSKQAREEALTPKPKLSKPIMEPEHELPAPKFEAKHELPAPEKKIPLPGMKLPPPPPPPPEKLELPKFHETKGVEFRTKGPKLEPLPGLEIPKPPFEKKGFLKKLVNFLKGKK